MASEKWESRGAVHYHPSGSWLQLGFMIGIHDHDDDDGDGCGGGDSEDAIIHYTIMVLLWDAVRPTCDALCPTSHCRPSNPSNT